MPLIEYAYRQQYFHNALKVFNIFNKIMNFNGK